MTDETSDNWDSTVHGKQRLFVLHYCTDEECLFNATASYEASYPGVDKSTAATNGSKLLKKPKVSLAIRRLLKLAQQDLDEENIYKTLHDMAMLATFNPADVLQSNGDLKEDLDQLGEKAKCIAQITRGKFGVQYTLIDRAKYLQMMGTYLNLVRPEADIDRSLPVIELPAKSDDEAWNAKAKELN